MYSKYLTELLLQERDMEGNFDQRLARMRDTARLAAAFYKGLIDKGLDESNAIAITAIYSVNINTQYGDDD